jgi:KDO2-lipid IV(A) lauroyltransferase
MPLVDPENVEKDATAIMAELNLVLESIVRRYPDQYLWLHDRWKEARHRGMV